METTTPLHGETSENPLKGVQRTYTRKSPCSLQGCLICRTPTSNDQPEPPPDHLILHFTKAIRIAIKNNNIRQLSAYVNQCNHQLDTNPEFVKYDLSDLLSVHQAATNILDSHTARSTPLPPSPPNGRTQTPSASFKPPKLIIENWNGKPYDFYSWLASILHGFNLAQCDNPGKLHHTLHAIPMDKRGVLNHIDNWEDFKIALIDEFGSINVFGREVDLIFNSLPRFESVQEIAEELAPKIKKLQSNLVTMSQFHKLEHLHGVAITRNLNSNIMRSLPSEVRPTFNEKYTSFHRQDPGNVMAPKTFEFLAQYVDEVRRNYQADPSLFDLELKSLSIEVKPVRPAPINTKPKPRSSAPPPSKPCTLCTVKGFQANHYPLNVHCGVGKLSSPDIIKIISDNHLCPSCTHQHEPNFRCKLTHYNGYSKVCSKGCLHDGLPIHRRACMHSNQTPSVTVSKVATDKSVPLVEDIQMGQIILGVQYDTGCQLSIISRSALENLHPSTYTLGSETKVRLMTYAGEGRNVLTTAVKLRIKNKTLKLSAIEDDLNHGSGFSFPVPIKWRSVMKTSTSQHTGRISILLGGDNHLFFPSEVERNARGMALYQSNLTQKYMIYGPVPPNTITWKEPVVSSCTNTLIINKLNIQAIQDQLLLTTSAEDYTTPSSRSLLLKLTKEKAIKDIMNNTSVDPVKNKTSVTILYKPNLSELGENHERVTKRINTMHKKIYSLPEIPTELDKYIQSQADKGNFVEINPENHRDEYQLHFVAYNYVVSGTSSSTKIRMTTDSSMRTETGLSLNDVTQPAPGNVPNLRGILMRSRCHLHYAVYDIEKFFRSVLISDKDSFLRIICVPSNSFSEPPATNPTWRYFRDRAIPFGDCASGDYASCAKTATVKTFIHEAPLHLQSAILQATLEDTYIDDGGVGANTMEELSVLQDEIEKILSKGGFRVKSWERSGENEFSKYLGMTWNRLKDQYQLKFRLNLHKKTRGIPSGEDLDSEFLQDPSAPITKKNVLSVACQFYDPTGLASPLMVSIRALFSEICRDSKCSFNSTLSEERSDRFRRAVTEILLTKEIFFPRQIIFHYSAQLYIFFDGSLQGYGACVYACSNGQFNLISSSAKILGNTAFSAPQSEMAGAVLASRMEQKIGQELSNVTLSPPVFIGDSEIVLKMIAKNDPAGPPVFYGTRLMEILSVSSPNNWFWCPGHSNPADLLTRPGTTCEQVNSKFWLNGSFLPQPESSWPTILSTKITDCSTPIRSVKILNTIMTNPTQDVIISLLEHTQSFSKVIKALSFIHKACRTWRAQPTPTHTWKSVVTSISSSIIKCYSTDSEHIIASNKMKHLVIQSLDGIYYVSDRSFRSRIGVPLICKKTILAKCIVKDAHTELGHGRDVLQVLSHIQSKFYIPGVREMITNMKKSCPGCIKLNKKPFTAFEADVPDVLKTVQPPFSYCQADIFGPVHVQQGSQQLKRWVLVILCLSSRGVHLEILHNYSSQSITRGFRRAFAIRGTPRIIWIDSGLNIVKAGKDLINTEMKVISGLNLKFDSIEFRVTLPKHHAGIGAVERIIGSIKNTVSKSVTGPHQIIMDDEELLTWIHSITEELNNRPLILGAPLGITLTPNHILQGFRDNYGDEVNTNTPVQHQLSRWNIALKLFNSLWEQEYTRRRLTVSWKDQGITPQVGDIVLFKNEPIYRRPISAARVEALLCRKNGDIYGATISYRREIGGRLIKVDRHLNQLYPFMGVEKPNPQEQIHGLAADPAGENVIPALRTQHGETQDEFYEESTETE